ncbi:MAG: ABC transporter permease [Acidobacteriota bacterium]|nr:ABC transporter permease [Acidobacteriota bacterium]MDH3783950.1 ABC transporter permease [Acidobacteriota bacterium]
MSGGLESTRRLPRIDAAIRAIALNTFREAIRDRVLYLLLVFALILIVVSQLLSLLTVGDEEKIIADMGLSAISIFGVLTAVFIGVSLVFKEIERRTVYTLLANPVRRWQFLLGKFVGLMAVLLMNVVLMSIALSIVLVLRGQPPWDLVPALFLITIELAVVTSFALLFSTLTNPILAAVWTFASYVAGHLAWSLPLLRDKVTGTIGKWVCDAVYAVMPHLHRLDIKADAVHGLPLPDGYVWMAALYGVSYAAVILLLASVAFERKDFNR